MNTLKKLDKMFGKYVGIAFSLLLIWIFKNDPGNLTYQIFFMSLLVSGFSICSITAVITIMKFGVITHINKGLLILFLCFTTNSRKYKILTLEDS